MFLIAQPARGSIRHTDTLKNARGKGGGWEDLALRKSDSYVLITIKSFNTSTMLGNTEEHLMSCYPASGTWLVNTRDAAGCQKKGNLWSSEREEFCIHEGSASTNITVLDSATHYHCDTAAERHSRTKHLHRGE